MKMLLFLFFSLPAFAQTLNLDDYLKQVAEKHGQYLSSQESYNASTLMAKESDIMLAPNLFMTATHTDDAKPSIQIPYDKLIDNNVEIGVRQQTSIGLSGSLSYIWDDLTFRNINFSGTPFSPSGTIGSPTLKLSISLWRNFWGAETRSQVDQLTYKDSAQKYSASFNMKSILSGAEATYWALALARESVKVAKDSVERGTELYKWNRFRTNSGLADKSDLLQADAALQSEKLALKKAQDDEITAARNFNSARGMDSTDVKEALTPLTSASLDRLNVPKRAEMRDDVRAALDQTKAAQAADEQARQSYKPTLELFGTAALNTPNPFDKANALADSFNNNRPTQIVGVRFSTPLDLGVVHDAQAGHAAAVHAAQRSYERRLFEQETGWHDLIDQFHQAKDRLTIYDSLEKVQKAKLDHERVRRQKGRTTTYQVILFESDYDQTQLARIQTMSQILQLFAQMKLYGQPSDTAERQMR